MTHVDLYGYQKLRASWLSKNPHFSIPGFNRNSDTKEIIEPYRYSLTCPVPFLPPERIRETVFRGIDPATELVAKKLRWEHQLDRKVSSLKSRRKERNVDMLGDLLVKEWNIATNYHVKFLELVDDDPDKYFRGAYNWYYSGGRLTAIEFEQEVYLLTVRGLNMDTLYIVPLEANTSWKPLISKSKTVTPKPGKEIFQVTGSDNGVIIIRYMNSCLVYVLKKESDGNLNIHECFDHTSRVPLIGVTVNPLKNEHIGTVDVGGRIILFDVFLQSFTEEVKVKKRKEHLCDLWKNIRFMDNPSTVMLVDRCCLNVVDLRQSYSSPVSVFCPQDKGNIVEVCETISCAFPSKLDHRRLYLGTSHHALLTDLRYNKEWECLQSWTHMLCSPPVYGCSVPLKSDKQELTFLANQVHSEIVVLKNDWSGKNPFSSTPPFILPTLSETCSKAKKQGLCLDPLIQRRMDISVTGVTSLVECHGSGVVVLTHTSVGDVFHQYVSEQDSVDEGERPSNSLDYLELSDADKKQVQNWELKAAKKKYKPKIKFTRKMNMKYIYQSLRKKGTSTCPRGKSTPYRTRWMKQKSELQEYKDFLSPKLLSVWNIDEASDWYSVHKLTERIKDSPSSFTKIMKWLESCSDAQTPTGKGVEDLQTQQKQMQSVGVDVASTSDSTLPLDNSKCVRRRLLKTVDSSFASADQDQQSFSQPVGDTAISDVSERLFFSQPVNGIPKQRKVTPRASKFVSGF